MTFLYPSFFWALAVLSIPIIIHLFNFRRTTKVYFSNNRFLKQVKEATTAKRRLKHYLILAARLLFLFFLVITFCQPIIPAREQLGSNRSLIFYLDNSQSMSASMKDKTRALDAGIGFITTISGLFPPDTRYKILTNDFAPYSNTYKTKSEVQEILTQIRLSSVSRSFQEVIDRINLNEHNRQTEVFWISDFQKSTLPPIPNRLDSSLRIHLVPISYGSLSNVFVDTAYLDNPFAAGGERNVLRVKVRNDGNRNADMLNLKLSINGVQAATTTISIPQGGTQETSFDLATTLRGLNQARITFNDFPVTFDNEFYLALNFTEKISVLEIKNSPASTPVEKVFGNTAVFNYHGFTSSNFNYSLLSQADLVVVNGLSSIDPSLAQALRNFINRSGSLMFMPGSKPDIANLKNFLQLPQLQAGPAQAPSQLEKPDFSNPFFENVFEEKSVSLSMPNATAMLNWGNDRGAILHFKTGQAFLSQFDQGGKLYLLASPLENPFTDLFNHAIFVPVMYRIAAASKKSENKLYYTLKESFLSFRIDSLNTDEPLKLVGTGEIIPTQRVVGERVLVDIPKFTLKEGFYKVVAGKDTVSLLAFNVDKEESLMAQYGGNEVKSLLGGTPSITIFDAGSTDAFSNGIKERYLGTPLWKYALILALCFLLAEVLLVRFLK
jgi:hypothetical protein